MVIDLPGVTLPHPISTPPLTADLSLLLVDRPHDPANSNMPHPLNLFPFAAIEVMKGEKELTTTPTITELILATAAVITVGCEPVPMVARAARAEAVATVMIAMTAAIAATVVTVVIVATVAKLVTVRAPVILAGPPLHTGRLS